MSSQIIKGDKKELAQQAADILTAEIQDLFKEKKKVIFGVVGGRNVAAIFQNLLKKDIDWSRVHFFMADERLVPPDHEQSNYKILKENLTDQLITEEKLPQENVHHFPYGEANFLTGTNAYTKDFKRLGEHCDLLLLSAGEDGHIASLFPDHSSMHIEEDSYIYIEDSPKEPAERISMSKTMITNTKTTALLFIGEEKKAAYDKFLDTEVDEYACPAKLIMQIPKIYILTNL